MQQKQKKSEAISKNTSSVAKMMLQRDKNKLREQQKHAYIELLKAPRGKEYLRLLAKTTELSRQLTDIADEIKQLELEEEQEAAILPASDALTEIAGEQETLVESSDEQEMSVESEQWDESECREKANSPEEEAQGEIEIMGNRKSHVVQENSEIQAVKEQSTIEHLAKEQPQIQVSWKNASVDTGASVRRFKERQKRLEEKKRQHEAIEEELRAAMEKFIAQLPVPEMRIGAIWPECNTWILMKYGVIGCPGSAYHSQEELIQQVQPRSEQEERQWLRGDGAYQTQMKVEELCERRGMLLSEGEKLLIVEIYMDAICIVYKDGHTQVIE